MKNNSKFFKNSKDLPVDKFFYNVMYDKKNGYYNSKYPFGNPHPKYPLTKRIFLKTSS